MKLITIFWLMFGMLLAPEMHYILIPEAKSINYYDRLIRAIVMVESSGGKYLYNAKEQAVGAFQIRPCRIDNYNDQTGSNYTLNDCYDYDLSRRIFLYYCHGKNYETAAKSWNGSGYKTVAYWNKVKKYL